MKDNRIEIHAKSVFNAANNLKSVSFKTWIYLTQFESKPFILNRANIMENMGISKNSYTSAIRELESKGYLIKNGKDHYVFHKNPDRSVDLP